MATDSVGTGTIYLTLVVFALCTAFLVYATWEGKSDATKGEALGSLRREYLLVYLLATFADWLQGPYVYALYASYGYSDHANAVLFVAGFGASMVFGTFVGALADKTGRMRASQLYCALYIVSCMTKHVSGYWILMIGRVTGGIATSLLFSVFEAWYVSEHNSRGIDPALLGETFGLAVFANSIVAVLAGFVSQKAAGFELSPPTADYPQIHVGGYTGPFDISILSLVVNLACIKFLWVENFGETLTGASGGERSRMEAMKDALDIVRGNADILCCGTVCALFEASMFIFVFKWTPGVTGEQGEKPPYGMIFAAFMLSSMLGSRIFSTLMRYMPVERIGQILLVIATLTHMVPLFVTDSTLNYLAFISFELTVGMYFPMMGTLKGAVVPEGCRATIYNIYRVPMNFIVLSALVAGLSLSGAFICTSLMLACAFLAQTRLATIRSAPAVVGGEPQNIGSARADEESTCVEKPVE